MIAILRCAAVVGVGAHPIDIEVEFTRAREGGALSGAMCIAHVGVRDSQKEGNPQPRTRVAVTREVEFYTPGEVEDVLHDLGFTHLRARKYGSAVIVESGPKKGAIKHFRARRDTVHLWLLDFANHKGKWEPVPFRGNLDDLLNLVVEDFPWTITDHSRNPERTSDRER